MRSSDCPTKIVYASLIAFTPSGIRATAKNRFIKRTAMIVTAAISRVIPPLPPALLLAKPHERLQILGRKLVLMPSAPLGDARVIEKALWRYPARVFRL